MSILSEITNVLNFEIKGLNIKILQIADEKGKLELKRNETLNEAQKLEEAYKSENKKMEGSLIEKHEQVNI